MNRGEVVAFPPYDIFLTRTKSLTTCIEEAAAAGRDRPNKTWVWDEDQIEIRIGKRRIGSLREFYRRIDGVIQTCKDDQLPRDDWAKATLHPMPGTLYIDTVKVVNECLRAGLTQLSFAGAPADS